MPHQLALESAPIRSAPGRRHALVVGGSIAGLLTARVLTEHFAQVTIVERDTLPDEPIFRPGVAQARHIHLLLLRGKQILEALFPGLVDDLAAAGVNTFDFAADGKRFSPAAGWGPRFSSPFQLMACSRLLLEWSIRERLRRHAQVSFLVGHAVTGLLADAERRRVVGVQVQPRPGAGGEGLGEHIIPADLVVDASGRDSQAPDWLADLGYTPPPVSKVNAFLGYATRIYAIPPGWQADWKLLWVLCQPPGTRTGGVFPIEGGRWMVSMFGAARDYPPTDEAGFLDFARSLAHPALYEAISAATPLSPIYGYRRTENCLRHYERLAHRPEGFIATGDAVCTFNPFYAQGMTVAAMDALVLDHSLQAQSRRRPDGDLAGLAQRFHRRLAGSHTLPWLMATGSDFLYPTTEGGQRSWVMRLMQAYFDRAWVAGAADPQVYGAFLAVMNLVTSPAALVHPRVLAAVLRHGLGRRKTTVVSP